MDSLRFKILPKFHGFWFWATGYSFFPPALFPHTRSKPNQIAAPPRTSMGWRPITVFLELIRCRFTSAITLYSVGWLELLGWGGLRPVGTLGTRPGKFFADELSVDVEASSEPTKKNSVSYRFLICSMHDGFLAICNMQIGD